jgi:hypothetical protein
MHARLQAKKGHLIYTCKELERFLCEMVLSKTYDIYAVEMLFWGQCEV